MVCKKCGTVLQIEGGFCTNCGENNAVANVNVNVQPQPAIDVQNQPIAQQMPTYAQPVGQQQFYVQPAPPKKKNTGAIVAISITVVVAIILAIVGIAFVVNEQAKENARIELESQLLRDWDRVEYENDVYYTLELDFSSTQITYNFDSYYVDETIAVYDYEVISGNQVEIDGLIYTIEFNDEKTMMTITPALTSTDSYENWFHLETY